MRNFQGGIFVLTRTYKGGFLSLHWCTFNLIVWLGFSWAIGGLAAWLFGGWVGGLPGWLRWWGCDGLIAWWGQLGGVFV